MNYCVCFSSPDSDDTYFGDDSEEGRDDQYLVSDRCESKFYGSVHGGSTAGSTAAAGGFSAASANITRSIKVVIILYSPWHVNCIIMILYYYLIPCEDYYHVPLLQAATFRQHIIILLQYVFSVFNRSL